MNRTLERRLIALETVKGWIEAAGGRALAGESWAEALGRLTGLSGPSLRAYLQARIAGRSHDQALPADVR